MKFGPSLILFFENVYWILNDANDSQKFPPSDPPSFLMTSPSYFSLRGGGHKKNKSPSSVDSDPRSIFSAKIDPVFNDEVFSDTAKV